MFGFTLTMNLNLYSGSGSRVWLNRTSNIIPNVPNQTVASLSLGARNVAIAELNTSILPSIFGKDSAKTKWDVIGESGYSWSYNDLCMSIGNWGCISSFAASGSVHFRSVQLFRWIHIRICADLRMVDGSLTSASTFMPSFPWMISSPESSSGTDCFAMSTGVSSMASWASSSVSVL